MSQVLSEKTCRVGHLSRIAKVTPETIWRWCKKGVQVNGERVYLEYVTIGGTILSSEEALSRFCEKCSRNRSSSPVEAPKPTRSNSTKDRAKEVAKQLQELLSSP